MARTRIALQKAVLDILQKYSANGKRLSYREAERRTGLSPATVGELAKGNARTPETVRRFAVGFGEDVNRLLLLAGFVPEDLSEAVANAPSAPISLRPLASQGDGVEFTEVELDEREWLGRFGRALAKMPPGRERELWKERLRHDTELLETFLERLAPADAELLP